MKIGSRGFNASSLESLDLASLFSLTLLQVGDECFKCVKDVRLIGMTALQRVVIGKGSFTQYGCSSPIGSDARRHFAMKNCPDVREVAIGCYSFSDYTVCEITDVNELKSIAFGEKEEGQLNFQYASLELDSCLVVRHSEIGLQSLESLLVGKRSFQYCNRFTLKRNGSRRE